MKIAHRFVGVSSGPELLAYLHSMDMNVQVASQVLSFEIDEGDPRYSAILGAAERDGLVDIPITTFTPQELRDADYVALATPAWLNGYPEPSDDSGYLRSTYDLSCYCAECGMGLQQPAPFRLKAPPKWGRREIFALNWVPDQWFVSRETWEGIFAPLGVHALPVVLDRSGAVLDNVVQLKVEEVVDVDMHDGRLLDIKPEVCVACGRERFEGWLARGFFPRPLAAPRSPIFKSKQYIGSGAVSANIVYVTAAVYCAMKDIRGVTFKPCLPAFPAFGPG